MRIGEPDGHGTYGYLDEDDTGLLCHACGDRVQHLATHARLAHDYTSAADYRARHGLKRTERMISTRVREKLSARWADHEDSNLRRLEATRNLDAARARSIGTLKGQGWSPAARAARQASVRERAGRDLTTGETARLGDDLTTSEWCRRVHRILTDDTVSTTSIARATGLTTGAVQQRLRRYPQE